MTRHSLSPGPLPPTPRRPGGVGGFTLVEMLTVMGIILVLLAATVPALKGPSGANARRGAVNNLLGAFDQARALAVSDGRNTYVVFASPVPKLSGGGQSAVPEGNKVGRAYAIFQDADNVNFTVVQRSAWMSFPVGVAFKVSAGKNGETTTLMNRPLVAGTDPQFLVPAVAAGAPANASARPTPLYLPYVKFDATGSSDLTPTWSRVLIFEGSVSSDGTEQPTKRAAGSAEPDAQRFVWEEVRLNYATGRARYTPDPQDIIVAAVATPSPTP